MKAVGILTDSPNTTSSTVTNGRVSKNNRQHHHGNRDSENEEVQMYLSKLRDLLPFKPRGRRLSKLEVIQNVIDYICDLQSALEAHPTAAGAAGAFDAAAVLSRGSNVQNGPQTSTTRQPLGVRSSTPNTILGSSTSHMMDHSNTSTSSSLSLTNSSTHSQSPSEKQPSPSSPPDGRSVSSSC